MILIFLFILVLFQPCISMFTITLNESLMDGDLLISEKGKFALGFFSPGKSDRKYIGIWYHDLPGQEVVWVANRSNPINNSSGVLSVTADGNLVLFSDQDRKVSMWSTNVSMSIKGACVAQLLDSGNLILVKSESGSVVWQSFDFPTNTMLPGMKLGLDWRTGHNRFLTSWKSADDPEIGEYSLKLNPSGYPQVFMYKGLQKYWRSTPWACSQSRHAPDIIFWCNFVDKEEETYISIFAYDESAIFRVEVDVSGILHRVTWYNSTREWKKSWLALNPGYGHCGANSIYSPHYGIVSECSCLPGYEPRSLKEWNFRDGTGGCLKKRRKTISSCKNGEGFVKVEHVQVPDTSVAALWNVNMSSEECQKLCFKNCSCGAYASIDFDSKRVGCMTWYGDIMDTIKYDDRPEIYIRVDAIEMAEIAAKSRSFFRRKSAIIGLYVAFLSCMIFTCSCFWLRERKIKGTIKDKHMRKMLLERSQHPDFPYFFPATIFAATDNFSPENKLGQGGFGAVYKGKLADGRRIAVKRLSKRSAQGIEEFENEVMLIARLQHRNLVKLLGCCLQEELLIYEYLPNKSLDTFIYDQDRRVLLDWRKRFDIIVGIARGMLYLHNDSRLRVVHRDLKTSNVLLDAEMNPKISDFGVARIFNEDQVQDNTKRIVGTYGYMAPEYAMFGKFSTKSDVFSFGVILLEIISGKKNSAYVKEPQLHLIGHVWDLWRQGKALEIVDSSLRDSYNPSEVVRCVHIGLLCVQNDKEDRPNMADVVLMLNSETSLPFPKEPAFILQKSFEDSSSSSRAYSVNEVTITMVESR